MRILSVHNRYLQRGGEDEVFEMDNSLLRERGHEIDEYIEDNHATVGMNPVKLGLRTVWSAESYRRVRDQLRRKRYDCIHVHNFFPLISPAIYAAARSEGVGVVQTLHNYRVLCAAATFMRDGKPCEECLGRAVPWPALRYACYRGQRSATFALAAMQTGHRAIGTWARGVDRYIVMTEFARGKFIEGGIPAERLVVRPNLVHPDPGIGPGAQHGKYILFVGRLTPEKGIDTLLRAWSDLQREIPLKIVGDGPLAEMVQAATAASGGGIEWLGHRSKAEAIEYMKGARALVFPSIWYETFGLVVFEAYAAGVPVIASDLGVMTELVRDRQTGLHFPAGDSDALAAQVRWAWSNPDRIAQMGHTARRLYDSDFTAEQGYRQLVRIYEEARESGQRAARLGRI